MCENNLEIEVWRFRFLFMFSKFMFISSHFLFHGFRINFESNSKHKNKFFKTKLSLDFEKKKLIGIGGSSMCKFIFQKQNVKTKWLSKRA